MGKRQKSSTDNVPIVKLRFMVMGLGLLAVLIAGPMLAVWKQVYINSASMRMNSMADSLVDLRKEIATLKLQYERSSSNEKIELFARNALQLEYPISSQIVIIDVPEDRKFFDLHGPRGILSYLKKTLGGDHG